MTLFFDSPKLPQGLNIFSKTTELIEKLITSELSRMMYDLSKMKY